MGARSSWGMVARSEAEFNEIVDNLNEQEANEKHMRTLAVDPPPMLDKHEKKLTFINRNGKKLIFFESLMDSMTQVA